MLRSEMWNYIWVQFKVLEWRPYILIRGKISYRTFLKLVHLEYGPWFMQVKVLDVGLSIIQICLFYLKMRAIELFLGYVEVQYSVHVAWFLWTNGKIKDFPVGYCVT